VFKGLDAKQTVELGWYLPRKNNRMWIDWLFTQDPSLINKQLKDLPGQYYLLKTHFKITATLKNGGWDPIVSKTIKSKPGDTSDVILQVRKRLFITRDLKLILKKTYLTMSY
jgi:hypothetical protein